MPENNPAAPRSATAPAAATAAAPAAAPASPATAAAAAVPGKTIIVQRTDASTFDDSFSFVKEKFVAEMKRLDDEMNIFARNLLAVYGPHNQALTAASAIASSSGPAWDALANSPLIEGEGDDKILKLRFDVSQFDPAEIKVELLQDVLSITARHAKTDKSGGAAKDFKREFSLPRGINADLINSTLTREGVLVIQAPIAHMSLPEKGGVSKTLSKNPQDSAQVVQDAAKGQKIIKTSAEHRKSKPKLDSAKMPGSQVPQAPLSVTSPASPEQLPSPQQRLSRDVPK